MLTKVDVENVFWCAKDEVAFASSEAEKPCSACGGDTKNIGWFENDGGDKTEKVNAIVKTATVEGRENLMEKAVADVTANAEELEVEAQTEPTPLVFDGDGPEDGVALGEDTEGDRLDNDEDALEDKEVEDEEDGEDGPADSEDSSPLSGDAEEDAEEVDPTEKSAELDLDAVAKMLEGLTDLVVKVNDRLAALESVSTKIDEIATLAEKFSDVSSKVDGVNKRIDAIDKSVAIKKSGDLGGSTGDEVEKSTKSIWGGRFLGSADKL